MHQCYVNRQLKVSSVTPHAGVVPVTTPLTVRSQILCYPLLQAENSYLAANISAETDIICMWSMVGMAS